ncbi:methylation-associated defense system ATP-binding protein MAD8 [Burkholderia gladioli]|uniref:methylation-associated defense system ATP-binding protein MAD8 n=1 Tax=Burkholderia gladioli TaxID=28095 RepID=UPI002FE10EF6
MSQGLRELTNQELNAALELVLLPRLSLLLAARDLGHCMRVTDLDRELMIRLAGGLRAAVPSANVVVLADDSLRAMAPDLAVSSTKLVELRNPLPNDEPRPPLLVFVPNDLRASAEDSFGVATFEEVAIDGAYAELNAKLIAQVPANLRVAVEASLSELRRRESGWRYADDAAVARYLLTSQVNEFDPDAMGAALFELALVPDFELFQQAERAPARVSRNRECVERITWSTKTERVRALELGLLDPVFCKQLGEFFSRVGVANPREWTQAIVRDRVNWPLAFNKWLFEDGGVNPDAIYIGDVVLPDLPVVKDDNDNPRLAELIGHKVLPISKTGLKKFSVSFHVDPVPSKVEGLSRFVAEVVSRDNGPTGLRRRKAAWAKSTDSGVIAFSSIGKIDWEEGWHYVRVYAETEDGDRIPLTDGEGNPVRFNGDASETHANPSESDLFYVVTDDEVEVEPLQRAVPREASLMHALLRARFAAVAQDRDPGSVSVTGCGWVERSSKAATSGETLEIRLGKEGKANVLVSGLLANLERAFLDDPDGLNRLRLSVSASGVATRSTTSFKWPISDEVARFREVRAAFSAAVLQGDQRLIMQASDLLHLQERAQNYAAAYLAWIDAVLVRSSSTDATVARQAMDELRCALTIDSVALVLEDYQGRRRDAVLLGPTHPLRANWHVAWSYLGQTWMEQSRSSCKEFVVPTRDAVIKQLAPAAFPPVVPFGEELGRTALAVDNINPFWSLYAATDEKDPRGLIGEVCAALGLPEPAIGGATIDCTYLAARVQRYLVQHPYVETLTINAFNAGRAGALAEVLLALQRHPEFADLRYDIRLFVLDPAAPSTGEALLELLSPDSGTSAKEADAFSTPTDSHLHPKLRLAIRAIKEFRDAPDSHAAHLSFLFDLFPAEEIRAVDVHDSDDTSFVHGLVQPFEVDYLEDEQSITWLRRPLHGVAQPLEGAEALSDLMGSISRAVSVAVATVARSQYLPHARPVVALSLSADERAMLHQVHEVSDWVLTIDRNLGIEFFDHRRHSTRPDYLIDHSPDMANAMSHRLAITSRSVAELESLLVPILGEYGLPNTGRHALVMLDQLRSLSGRLALKLLSSSSQRAEAMGLALSRLFLEHQGVFQNQVVVPLDAHLELYKALRQTAEEMGDEVSFRRTDLALFDLDPSSREVTCRLVEVKCYSQVGDVAAYAQLKASIAEQIAQTEEVLAYHFDPKRAEVDRPDRPIKNRDLAALLGFYLDRSERYGVVLPEAVEEAHYFLRRLDERPYTLKFTRSAVVFDFSKPGTEPAEHENGIEYYRIGSDLIRQLVESAVTDTESVASVQFVRSADTAREVTQELLRRRELAPAVPTFEAAAFLSPPRDRTLAWDDNPRVTYQRPEVAPNVQAREPEPVYALQVTPLPIADAQLPIVAAEPTPSPADEPVPASISTQVPMSAQAVEVVEPEGSSAVRSLSQQGATPDGPIAYDIMLGATGATPQYGLLGEVSGRKVALDLNQTHTISLFGVQGGGKSYTLGSVAEMASLAIPGINCLPEPLSTVIFHYSPTMDYKPEFTSMVGANCVEDQVRALKEVYGAEPKALADVLLLVPADKIEERQGEYPDIEVQPLQFSASELKASHWKFLMGAVGNQATYIRQIMRIMKTMRDDITLEGLRAGIDSSSIPDHLKELGRMRLDLAAEYINDATSLTDVVRPGRLIIVDLRDEFIEKDEALGLFVVLLQLFADARIDGRSFNKLVVFDEAHKYIESPDLVAGLIEVVREMRHKGVSIMVASQDPPSVPVSLIELSSQIIMHKFNSPAWLKHIQKANAALANLTPERMALLKAGEAYVWSSKATDESFSKGAVKLRCRPRVTQHGGATRVAVKN